jgi:non-ribosomal peptide synthetase component F
MVVCILGILKAGGAYVPVDPLYPPDRIDFILRDTGCTVVLADNETAPLLQQSAASGLVNIEKEEELIQAEPATPVITELRPHHLA